MVTGTGGVAHAHGAWHALAGGLADFLLPPACAVCRRPHRPDVDGIVCGLCTARLVALAHPVCLRCGHPRLSAAVPGPVGEDADATGAPHALPVCRWCDRLPPYVRAVRSACRMDDGAGAALVHALKYERWPGVAVAMARRMARLTFPADVVAERTALVPLPLSRTRQRERGYNQAEQLARALAPHWSIPVWTDVLVRRRDTRSQVRLTPAERASNVSGAFAAAPGARARLRGAHVVLVDDVITTAASLNAAALALVEGGTRIISYVTFGRAPETGDRTSTDFDLDTD